MKRILSLMVMVCVAGCSSNAINSDSHNTFLDSDDLVRMTDKMAASFATDPRIVAQVAAQGRPLVIVIKPIVNDTNQIIRPQEKLLYVARMEDLLGSKQSLRGQFTFVLTREDYAALIATEGKQPGELGPDPARTVPDYVLSGNFEVLTNDNGTQRSDYYYCRYVLTRITGQDSGVQLWTDKYETKKVARKGLLD